MCAIKDVRMSVIIIMLVLRSCSYTTRGGGVCTPYLEIPLGRTIPAYRYRNKHHLPSKVLCDAAAVRSRTLERHDDNVTTD